MGKSEEPEVQAPKMFVYLQSGSKKIWKSCTKNETSCGPDATQLRRILQRGPFSSSQVHVASLI